MSAKRCLFVISPRSKCWSYAVRGYEHCRHHLTDEERARRSDVAAGRQDRQPK